MVLILFLLQRVGVMPVWHSSPIFVTEQGIIDAYVQGIQTIMLQTVADKGTVDVAVIHEALLTVRVPEEIREPHLHAVLTLGGLKGSSNVNEQEVTRILQTLIDNAQSL